jgi:hypothetical protein
MVQQFRYGNVEDRINFTFIKLAWIGYIMKMVVGSVIYNDKVRSAKPDTW